MTKHYGRIVFDTNVVGSLALRPVSVSGQAFLEALRSSTLLASTETLDELEAVFSRRKFDKVAASFERALAFQRYKERAEICAVMHTVTDCRDPSDNKFLALALSGRADLIVSGDEDLLALHPWSSIPILSPAGYLAQPA